MRLGVMVPHIGFNAGATAIRDVAQAAEALGFASVWTADHLVAPAETESEYPFNADHTLPLQHEQPYFEIFPTLGFLAAVTSSVRLGTGVVVVPYRNPVLLSKLVTTVDALSEGRFVFGVGVGYLREEFDAVGARFAGRGTATDEALEFLNRAWYGEQPVRYADGPLVHLHPGPHAGREIPVWIGGVSTPARRRVARYGSGWIPHLFGADPDWISACVAEISAQATEFGRSLTPSVALFVPLRLTDDAAPDAAEPWLSGRLEGDPARVAEVLARYEACGVDEVIFMNSGAPDRRIAELERIAAQVLPRSDS